MKTWTLEQELNKAKYNLTTYEIKQITKAVLEIIGKDEEQYPSGYQRSNILTRNKLRTEMRRKLNETNKR